MPFPAVVKRFLDLAQSLEMFFHCTDSVHMLSTRWHVQKLGEITFEHTVIPIDQCAIST